jgi:hypothetical protein
MTDRRDIGEEILEGIRQLKRGESGRAGNIPSVFNRICVPRLSWKQGE